MMGFRERVRRPSLAAIVALAVASGGLLASGAPALALITHKYSGQYFGPEGPAKGAFTDIQGIAVEQETGTVYVMDTGVNGGTVYKFNAAGEPQSYSGIEGAIQKTGNGGTDENELAASSTGVTKGDIYVANNSKTLVYGSDGTQIGELNGTGTPWGENCGVAVDPLGNVYLGIYSNTVNKYVPNSNPVVNGDYVSSITNASGVCNVAADAAGTIYAAAWSGGPVYRFPVSGEPSSFGGGGTLAVDPAPSNDDVYVNERSMVGRYDFEGNLLEKFGATGEGAISNSWGIGVNHSLNEIYVPDGKGHVEIFASSGIVLPDVRTKAPTGVTRSEFAMNGTVNPDEITVTSCRFEYRSASESTFTHTAACSPEPGEGNSPVAVSAKVTGLSSKTPYYFRLAAANKNGEAQGSEVSVETAGAVEGLATKPTTNVTAVSATLNASVDPNGYAATCWFNYGKHWWEYNQTTEKVVYPASDGPTEVHVLLTELNPHSEYEDTFVCENSLGKSEGVNRPFVTLASPPIIYSESTEAVSRQRAVLVADINPANDETAYFFEYGLTSEYGYKTPANQLPSFEAGHVLAKAPATELETNTLYHFRVVSQNSAGTVYGEDQTFTSGHLTPPAVSTGGASSINPNGAVISGVVNTEGLVSTFGFRVGTSPEDLGPATGMGSVGAGFKEAAVSLELYGLQPQTTYYYRIVGENVDNVGSPTEGEIRSFTTTAYPNPNITVEQLRVLTEPFVGWPPAGPARNTACPQGCTPEIRVISHSVQGKLAIITVSVPSAGRLVASGSGIHRASRIVRKAGTLTMRLRLSKSGRRFLARHHGRNLVVPITLSFVPSHGERISARVAVLMH